MELITPTWVIVSTPPHDESPYGHPHDDALELYRKHVDDDRLLILGGSKVCAVYDIYPNGDHTMDTDNGDIVAAYGFEQDDDGPTNGARSAPAIHTVSRIDSGRPMGDE
jgi:hypothetical protein